MSFADDTVLFCEPKRGALLNIICVLMGFQAIFGFNINLAKSKVVRLGSGDGLARALGCRLVSLPITYLRLHLPLGVRFKEERTSDPVVNRFRKEICRIETSYVI